MHSNEATPVRVSARAESLEARLLFSGGGRHAHEFVIQTNLVSDGAVQATTTDPNLVNPWGVAYSPGSPFWVADNGKGVDTVYDGIGTKFARVVNVPGPAGTSASAPSGIVYNGSSGFFIGQGDAALPARFIFVGEDGIISGWNKDVDGNNAILAVDHSASGAVYKGAALGDLGGGTLELFVANFHDATVEVYDNSFAAVNLTGAFHDRKIPAGYAPFNIQSISGKLYVTYAKQDSARHDDVPAAGNGYVDVYDTSGRLLQRLQHGKFLDSPWGVAVAPSTWGKVAGDILVGQFGSGRIDAFNPKNGSFVAYVASNAKGTPLAINGLWGLTAGNSLSAGDTSTIYFTAGPNHEADGLFGSLTFTVTVIGGHGKQMGGGSRLITDPRHRRTASRGWAT